MELAKINQDGLLDLRFISDELKEKIEELKQNGFLEFVRADQPIVQVGYDSIDSFLIKNNKLIQSWSVIKSKAYIQLQIDSLKNELIDSDYMVIKNYESTQSGNPPCYDPKELHLSREQIRIKIRELEIELNS